jgi:hypothetical protein
MARSVAALVQAARCPSSLVTGDFGEWRILRHDVSRLHALAALWAEKNLGPGIPGFVALEHRIRSRSWECVMDDSPRELRRHLPIWMVATGRVLVTGLGLGCVVRGLLTLPEVVRIDVVELDPLIIATIGPEFLSNPRVVIWEGDALTLDLPEHHRWEYAWHDLWSPPGEPHLNVLHAELMARYHSRVGHQGAWQFHRPMKRLWPHPLLGAPAERWRAS